MVSRNLKNDFNTFIMGAKLWTRKQYFKQSRKNPSYVRNLMEAYASEWRDIKCVFVLSTGRTGTMLLASLLNLSKEIYAVHEATPSLMKAGYDSYFDEDGSDKWIDIVHVARDELISHAHTQKKIYVETNNQMTFLGDALKKAYPNSLFIHLHRHPFEVIRSGRRRKWYNGNVYDIIRVHPMKGDPLKEVWRNLSIIEKLSWLWTRINEHSLRLVTSIEDGRGFELRSEQLFRADLKRIKELFEFIGVDVPPDHKIKALLAKKLNVQRKGSYIKADEWAEEEKLNTVNIVGKVARKLGYEL
jgi:hypothetical protein